MGTMRGSSISDICGDMEDYAAMHSGNHPLSKDTVRPKETARNRGVCHRFPHHKVTYNEGTRAWECPECLQRYGNQIISVIPENLTREPCLDRKVPAPGQAPGRRGSDARNRSGSPKKNIKVQRGG